MIKNTLTFYGINFTGWSGLVRRTCLQYNLPDPLQYLQYPWRPDRWRAHCKQVVQKFWDRKLINIAEDMPTLIYMDTEYISTSVPMRIWQLAGLCSDSVRAATIVNWMVMGVYFTRELLFSMKKVETPKCLGCSENVDENLTHFLLYCSYYKEVRESYLPRFVENNKKISEILENETLIMLSILDPLHSKLPESISRGWQSGKIAYEISRKFCFNMHMKREKLYKECDKKM